MNVGGFFACGELLQNLWPSGAEIPSHSPKEVLKDYMTCPWKEKGYQGENLDFKLNLKDLGH